MRAQLWARRDISKNRFIQFGIDANGVFSGFADGAFDWYHSTIGISFRGREQRPQNEFEYSLSLEPQQTVSRERPDHFLGDLQIGIGQRHGSSNQTTLLMTLPTSTAPTGYSKETMSVGLVHTMRGVIGSRLSYDVTAGLGYTPASGEFAAYQNEIHNSASGGIALRLFGQFSAFGYLYTHSPLFDETTLLELENREVSGDFGFRGRTASGREWRVGFSEDFGPDDAGIDLILRFGIAW
jgi:hypothetical protein